MTDASRPGRLVAICGIDGSGKATQSAVLATRASREGWDVHSIAFPTYGEGFFANLIEQYLRGELAGGSAELSPYLASLPYACDRWQASSRIRAWLSERCLVVADRYVSANLAYQGSKVGSPAEREQFYRWDEEMEYEVFGLPRPDLQVLLRVPPEVARKYINDRTAKRLRGLSPRRRKGRALPGQAVLPRFEGHDIHEINEAYLARTAETYVELAERDRARWAVVECSDGATMLPRETIAESVWQAVRRVL